MLNKKGLSGVIVTMIIVAFSLVLITVLWVSIQGILDKNAGDISLGPVTVGLQIRNVEVIGNSLEVAVKRNPGPGDLVKLKFVVSNETDSQEIEKATTIKEMDLLKFILNETDLGGIVASEVVSVSVDAILISSSGEEFVGNVVDNYEIVEEFCETNNDCSGNKPYCNLTLGKCAECLQVSHCEDSNECTTNICSSGICLNSNVIDETICEGVGTCCGGVCNTEIINSDFNESCRSGLSCVGTRWEYSILNNGELCEGACRQCSEGYCSFDNNSRCSLGETCSLGDCNFNFDGISWWKFENNADDETGLNDGIEVGGVLYTPGKFGNALSLDGIESKYIDTGITGSLGQKVTISAWVKFNARNAPGGGREGIIGSRYWYDGDFSFHLHDSDNRLLFSVGDSKYFMWNIPGIDTSQFYHLLVVYDSTQSNIDNKIKLYVNGTFIPKLTYGGITNQEVRATTRSIQIGQTSETFNGTIDEVMIWNRALSEEEIHGIYNANLG